MSEALRTVAIDAQGGSIWGFLLDRSLHGILRYAADNPSWKLLFNDGPLRQRGSFARYEDLPALKADGLIVYGPLPVRSEKRIARLGIPAASIPQGQTDRFPSVRTDFVGSGRAAAQHLLDRGFVHFAFAGNLARSSAFVRCKGFAETLAARRHSCSWFSLRGGPAGERLSNARQAVHAGADAFGPAPRERALREWLVGLPKPVGVMASSDRHGQIILNECEEAGLAIPGAVAVVGVGNNELVCESTRPPLSSVDTNGARIGYEAARLLDHLMAGLAPPEAPIWIPPRGVVTRGSSDVLAVKDPYVRAAVDFIRRNLSDPIGLRDVVRASGVSCTNLERRFHTALGCTINAELLRQRIERAQHLMVGTDLSLSQIAELSGFRCSYFRNVFTERVGKSPGQWRQEHL